MRLDVLVLVRFDRLWVAWVLAVVLHHLVYMQQHLQTAGY
jgi:hypothetical protein